VAISDMYFASGGMAMLSMIISLPMQLSSRLLRSCTCAGFFKHSLFGFTMLGSSCDHVGVTLGLFWGHLGIILGPFSYHAGVMLGEF
jgi:hypothetical protein